MPRFEKGNAGGPGGSTKKDLTKTELETSARLQLSRHFARSVRTLLTSKDQWIILNTLKWLTDRAFGKAPMYVKGSGIEPGSPEWILLKIAEQQIPGAPDEEGPEPS